MKIRYEAETGTCPSKCRNGFISCPNHLVETDEDGWCTECDTPADEIDPQVSCQDEWHD